MVSDEHNEWCESLEPGDCVRSDNDIVEVERKGSGYIVVANEPDVTKRYREYDSLRDLPSDAFDYDALSGEDANLIDRTIIEECDTRYSLDRLQRTLRHKHNYELPADVKPTANPSAYLSSF